MATTDIEAPTQPEPDAEPAPVLSLTIRRSGRLGTRILAVIALLAAIGATGYVVATGMETSPRPPMEVATADAWERTGALSDALRALQPRASRTAARSAATAAADAVSAARTRVKALTLPTSDTPLRSRVQRALRADAAWIGAVGSTLANPRSRRRTSLAGLARRAAEATSLVAKDVEGASGSVGGTSRLLAATKPA